MPALPPVLLDASVLIALTVRQHVSHERAQKWFGQRIAGGLPFATCPITQGALIRFHCREGTIKTAKDVLRSFTMQRLHDFWPDDLPYAEISERGLRGHKQVTDFYLAALARNRKSKLVTLDESLAAVLPDYCTRI